jgi:hypothetical protein
LLSFNKSKCALDNSKINKQTNEIKKTTYLSVPFCFQVNEVTKNFRLIRDCFSQYFSWMTRFQHVHQQNPDDPRLSDSLPKFRRAMFTVGLLVRHFDFSKQQLYEGLPVSLFKDYNSFELPWYFVSKIVLTFCEKKKCSTDRETLLRFEAVAKEFAKILRSRKQLFLKVKRFFLTYSWRFL